MANYFERFHDQPPDAAPSGDPASPNYFSRFHGEAPQTVPAKDGAPAKVIIDTRSPPTSQGEAAIEGAKQGISAGFGDEIYGASKASGAPDWAGGFRAPIGAARLLYEGATGQNDPEFKGSLPEIVGEPEPEPATVRRGEATRLYEEAVAEKRKRLKELEHDFPKTFVASEIAGGLATPLPGASSAKAAATAALPWYLRAAETAKTGAAYGATAGVGSGEGAADSLVKAGTGAVTGGAIGGAARPVTDAVGTATGFAAKKMQAAWDAIFNPEAAALRKAGTALKIDANVDPAAERRLRPTEMVDTPSAVAGDMGGDVTRRLMDSAAITNPIAGAKLTKMLSDRSEGQFSRITDYLRSKFNYPDAAAQKAAIDELAKDVNNPAYRKAMDEGKAVWSKELQRLAGAPSIQEAARASMQSLKDRGISEGFQAPRSMPLTFNSETGRAALAENSAGNQILPDLRFWDQVKRHLDERIDRAEAKGENETFNRLTALKGKLVDELDKNVASYKAAREGAAHFFGQTNALKAGEEFVRNTRMSNNEARFRIGQMNDTEKQLFKDGFVSRYINDLSNVSDRRNILNKIADNPAARERLEIVMGKDGYKEFDTMLRLEGIQQLAHDVIKGNSWTAKRLIDQGLIPGAGVGAAVAVHGGITMDPKEMTMGALTAALLSGGKHVDQRLTGKIIELFMSKDPAMMQKAAQMVSQSAPLRGALMNWDRRVVAATAQRGPTASVGSKVSGANADDQKQDVPGIVNP